MFFSIITVSYNEVNNIGNTINSVLNQTFQDFEYIVVDGKSNDGTYELEKKLLLTARCVNVQISSEEDSGIYNAMNKGIKKANGEWLLFLNAGDSLASSDVLDKINKSIVNGENADIYYGDTVFRYKNYSKLTKPQKISEIKEHMVFGHPSSVIGAGLMKECLYDESYRIAADFNFFLRAALNNARFCYIDYPVSKFELGGCSCNGSYASESEMLRSRFENNIIDQKIFTAESRKIEKRKKFYNFAKKIIPSGIFEKWRVGKLIKAGFTSEQ